MTARFCGLPRHQLDIRFLDYAGALPALVRSVYDGAAVKSFECSFAKFVGCRHAIAVASGRIGLELVARHLGKKPGSEIVVAAFNYFAVIERFIAAGFSPRFVDVSRSTLHLDPSDVQRQVRAGASAILATHMFGGACDMDRLCEIADQAQIPLIEDCAHAFGSRYKGRHAGSFGYAGVFSLSAMKTLTGFGGGVIVTQNDELANAIRCVLREQCHPIGTGARLQRFIKGALLDFGTRTIPYSLLCWPGLRIAEALRPGFATRMMTQEPAPDREPFPMAQQRLAGFQAVLASAQLARATEMLAGRQRVREALMAALRGVNGIEVIGASPEVEHSGLYFGVLVENSQEVRRSLFALGIDSETSEYRDCSGLPMYRDHGRTCRNSAEIERKILRIPCNPTMTSRDIETLAERLRQATAQRCEMGSSKKRGLRSVEPVEVG